MSAILIPMAKHMVERFTEQEIDLDGNEYEHCVFESCRLTYSGGEVPLFEGCNFTDCDWDFAGAALNTMRFMMVLRASGMMQVVRDMSKAIMAFDEAPDQPVN